MKIRIQRNSLRLRLSEAEVKQFGNGHRVEETIFFGLEAKDKLTYILTEASEKNKIDVLFKDTDIIIQIPPAQVLI